MDKVDCIVIGAGVIGLAVARALAQQQREVLVLETNTAIGMETSSRNSEVVHAGLYYPTNSLKARLCVSGRAALLRYCDERGITYRQCGKLVVASSDAQRADLTRLLTQAEINGVTEIELLNAQQAQALEPELVCVAALQVRSTAILDSHHYLQSLHGDAENAGALFAFNSRVLRGSTDANGIVLNIATADTEFELHAQHVINCAGLMAPALATRIQGLQSSDIPHAWFAKGSYFALTGITPFSHLIYPLPEPGGLGVHLTLDLAGQARFGPDVEWLQPDQVPSEVPISQLDYQFDYQVDPARANGFYAAIRRYWPGLPDHALQPAYAGIRPKINSPHTAAADFLFASHQNPHYLGLYGIESPGLTASLAIAEHVSQMILKK
ncbi:MAG: NAD(P)/FAD-dependent oxidoreductase [Herbaspirillum sp.]